MAEALFDLSEEYERMLNQGISLSGEDLHYFVAGRLAALVGNLPKSFSPQSVLDFGCGVGHATGPLAKLFPRARVTGMDTSQPALDRAAEHHPGCRFLTLEAFREDAEEYDLCYVNGVFHHIPPVDRPEAIQLIYRKLRPGGLLFLFENNPWNPGTRMVMSRIPFDRDAITLSIPETARLEESAGFSIHARGSLFFFPRVLALLRPLEPLLSPSLLGAQYFVAGRR